MLNFAIPGLFTVEPEQQASIAALGLKRGASMSQICCSGRVVRSSSCVQIVGGV